MKEKVLVTRNSMPPFKGLQNIFFRKYFYQITADAVCFKNKYKQVL